LTVAESHQPYAVDWIGQMGWVYVLLFIVASIYLFYNLVKPLKKYKIGLTLLYIYFIFTFSFSRYSSSSILNGDNGLSKFFYLGSLFIFGAAILIGYLYLFYKNKESFEIIKKLSKEKILIFVWFLFMIIAARTAIRLLFIFSPITTLLAAYLIVSAYKGSFKFKEKSYKILLYISIVVVLYLTVFSFAKTTYAQAKYTGPSYNQQWQYAMEWVRENTPEDAVFAHWWDYGYWVQTGGGRATITDGGNVIGAWNHFMGRHVLTANIE
jgi:hypothetical protein